MIEQLNRLDRELFLLLNSFHYPWLDEVMVILSGQLIWAPLIIFFVMTAQKKLGWKMTGLFTLFLVLAIVASDVSSSYMLKNLVNRLRPCREEDLRLLIYSFGQKCGGKFGFVSSHAANSFALLTFSTRALGLSAKWWPLWVLGMLVSYSRIYLGVHYPGDILGGVSVGVLWGLTMSWVFLQIKDRDAP